MPGLTYTIWPQGAQYPLHVDGDGAKVKRAHFGERHITVERDNMVVAEVFNAVAWESRPLNPPEELKTSLGFRDAMPSPTSESTGEVEGYTIPYSL